VFFNSFFIKNLPEILLKPNFNAETLSGIFLYQRCFVFSIGQALPSNFALFFHFTAFASALTSKRIQEGRPLGRPAITEPTLKSRQRRRQQHIHQFFKPSWHPTAPTLWFFRMSRLRGSGLCRGRTSLFSVHHSLQYQTFLS
jgi:hypothetical protein